MLLIVSLAISDPWYYCGWSDSALHLFDMDPAGGSLRLNNPLVVEQRTPEHTYSNGDLYRSRSVLLDDAVFFIYRGVVHSAFWQ